MKPTRSLRELSALALCCSLLLGLFACGLHHGQASGLALSGLAGEFCSLDSDNGAGVDLGHSGQGAAVQALGCPLCSLFGASVAVDSAGWGLELLAPDGGPLPTAVLWARPPPRFLRHSLNPRASPAFFLA